MGGPLDELVVGLFLDPDTMPADMNPLEVDVSAYDPNEPVFAAYCVKALALVENGTINADDVRTTFDTSASLNGANREYVLDLLVRVANALDDDGLAQDTTAAYLDILVGQVNACMAKGGKDEITVRQGQRIADRALTTMNSARSPVETTLAAEVHRAVGSTCARPVLTNLAMAFKHYADALRLKREAGIPTDDAEKLLGDMIDHAIHESIGAQFIGGAGFALIDLEAAYEAARVVGRKDLVIQSGLNLADTYQGLRQAKLAEPLLRSMLDDFELEPALRLRITVSLAASLSEQFRFPEALAILESIPAGDLDDMGRVCLANCKRETGDVRGARELFEAQLAEVQHGPDEAPLRKIQLMVLAGQAACMEGDSEPGLRLLRDALALAKNAPPVLSENLHRDQIAARCFVDAGQWSEARECIERARHLRSWHLENKATPGVLESILGGFRELDFYDVELALNPDGGEGAAYALTAAESAKGRLLTWSQHHFDPAALKRNRVFDRREGELARVQTWLTSQPGTRVVSLFAATRGLALFSLDAENDVQGRWLGNFHYPTFVNQVFEPWERAAAVAHNAQSGLWDLANIGADRLLAQAGGWLWQAFPDLMDGGERLIVIPHRLFRSLPLAAAQMPDGSRLIDRYAEISIVPSLAMLADACERQSELQPTAQAVGPPRALIDPDGSLPFARLEVLGLDDAFETAFGADVTVDAMKDTFFGDHSSTIHLSCHGDFNETNAWQSRLRAADGDMHLGDLLMNPANGTDLVVLGACEAGKTQRSASDEPIGFAELLLQAGVGTVVSPVWKIDDLASLLFLTEFHRRRHLGVGRSVGETTRWLRDLTVLDARRWLDVLRAGQGETLSTLPADEREALEERLDALRAWLQAEAPNQHPFAGPLDWAGFQATGLSHQTQSVANDITERT